MSDADANKAVILGLQEIKIVPVTRLTWWQRLEAWLQQTFWMIAKPAGWLAIGFLIGRLWS